MPSRLSNGAFSDINSVMKECEVVFGETPFEIAVATPERQRPFYRKAWKVCFHEMLKTVLPNISTGEKVQALLHSAKLCPVHDATASPIIVRGAPNLFHLGNFG